MTEILDISELEEFPKGTKGESSFRINLRGSLIYIRYFAVCDAQKTTMRNEMSHDITDRNTFKGEKAPGP